MEILGPVLEVSIKFTAFIMGWARRVELVTRHVEKDISREFAWGEKKRTCRGICRFWFMGHGLNTCEKSLILFIPTE